MSINARELVPTWTIIAGLTLAAYGGRATWTAELAFWATLLAALVFLIGVYVRLVESELGCAAFIGIALSVIARILLGRSGLGPGAAALCPALLAAPALVSAAAHLAFRGVCRALASATEKEARKAPDLAEVGRFLRDPRDDVFDAARRRFGELARGDEREAVRLVASLARSETERWKSTTRLGDLVSALVTRDLATASLHELFETVGEWSCAGDRAIQKALLARPDLDIAKLADQASARLESRAPYRCPVDGIVARLREMDDERGRDLARRAFFANALSAESALGLGEEDASVLAAHAVERATETPSLQGVTMDLIGRLPARRSVALLAKAIATWNAERDNVPFTLDHHLIFRKAPLLANLGDASDEDRAALARALDARLAATSDRYQRRIYEQLRALVRI